MKIKSIEEIIDISKYHKDKKSIKLRKFLKRQMRVELKQVKRTIKKLYKLILKSAKRGDFSIHYDKYWFTTSQISTIKDYFTQQGYVIDIFGGDRIKPLITIKWERKVDYENQSPKIS